MTKQNKMRKDLPGYGTSSEVVVGAAQANKDLPLGSETLRLTELLLFVLLETH